MNKNNWNKKSDCNKKRDWKVYARKIGLCLGFVLIAVLSLKKYSKAELADDLSHKVLRFHVLANSDEEKDQQLKLQVRDAVGSLMHEKLAGVESLEESKEIVLDNLDEIIATAEDTIHKQGADYEVRAALDRVDFPEKTYGNYCFPAGNYQALQLIIGEGAGQNWWCVMYPNMCFFNSIYEVVEDEADESLRQVLTTEEYKAVMEKGEYEIEFKWLSFLND